MICKIYLSFNQLTSVNTPPPAWLTWRQKRTFRPAGLDENFRDRMSRTHCSCWENLHLISTIFTLARWDFTDSLNKGQLYEIFCCTVTLKWFMHLAHVLINIIINNLNFILVILTSSWSTSVFCPRAGPSLQTQAQWLQFCPKAGVPL